MNPRRISFFLNNRRIEASEGDSIAKALFEAGVRTLSWSVKYRRPRGIHCARGRCIMCHMEVNGVPGVPTCITPAEEGMRVRHENFQPFFAPLLVAAARVLPFPAGFYYRMFTRPTFLRRLFLGTLRRMAGVGRVDTSSASRRPPRTVTALFKPAYDVVVVGAGLSGMAAALAAANGGATVLLVDEYGRLGGHSIGFLGDAARASTRDRMAREITSHPAIDTHLKTTAQGFYPPDVLLLGPGGSVPSTAEARGMSRVRATDFVFATGRYDIVPLFENSDTPGIFGARALRLLLERDGLLPGSNAVVYGSGDELSLSVALLRQHGARIAAIVDVGAKQAGAPAGVPYHSRARIAAAHGGPWLRGVRLQDKKSIACDMLCTAFTGQGAYELAYQAGFRFEMSQDNVIENKVMVPTETERHAGNVSLHLTGELAGHHDWKERVASGEKAGNAVQSRQHGMT